jgi:hypothetical protein
VDRRAGFIERSAHPAGDHGHDPSLPEMDTSFVVAGGVPRDEGRDLLATRLAHPLRLPLP